LLIDDVDGGRDLDQVGSGSRQFTGKPADHRMAVK
jgi:hypothetical protein